MSEPTIEHVEKDGFRLRGVEVSRIDAFSDVVFGFALTLLVVSLSVPKTYTELRESLHGLLPFAICFLFLMLVWHGHYKYFRRFGTHDLRTIVINGALLFVILFYVYPLKFLFTFVVAAFSGDHPQVFETYRQLVELMVLYGIGFTAIYLLMAALYWNGYSQRKALELNHTEELLARSYIVGNLGVAAIGVLACVAAVAVPERFCGLTGWTYSLVSVFKTIHGRRTRKKVAREPALHHLTRSVR